MTDPKTIFQSLLEFRELLDKMETEERLAICNRMGERTKLLTFIVRLKETINCIIDKYKKRLIAWDKFVL